jgi:hypothetical protein
MKNFEDFKYFKNATETESAAKKEFFDQLEQTFYEEIKDNEKTAKFLANYYGSNNDSFLKGYARKKAELIKHLTYHQSIFYQYETDELEYQKKADIALDLILQKKLFNLQLQWRAGKIELPDVEVCFDFVYWGRMVRNCPFIPEITENEVQLVKDYLLSLDDPDVREINDHTVGQDYEEIMEIDEYGDRSNMPEWYEFYDSRMGTSMLLLLPDNRGKREDFYHDLLREEYKRTHPESNKPAAPVDNRPMLSSYNHDIVDFARYIETDPYILELFRYHEFELEEQDRKPDQWNLDAAIATLLSADRPIRFNPTKNWDEAIFLASYQYVNRRIVEAIDLAYAQYLMYRDLGIVESGKEDKHEIKPFYNEIRQKIREDMKRAKLLNGEME